MIGQTLPAGGRRFAELWRLGSLAPVRSVVVTLRRGQFRETRPKTGDRVVLRDEHGAETVAVKIGPTLVPVSALPT